MNTATEKNHIGRKISRIRELKGLKQEVLADALGISQQSVSKLEQSETLGTERLHEIAAALGVTKDAIENFSEDAIFHNINNFNDNSTNNGPLNNFQCTFNPLEKLVEAFEENKKLYQQLLQSEKDKVAYLEKLLNK
ncbi:MAG: helix-turn-helix transcriptional regulator [Sediminicola sp.]